MENEGLTILPDAHTNGPFTASTSGGVITARLPLGPEAQLWDEFSPALYRLTITLACPAGNDTLTLTTGLREFTARGTQFAINGRTIFLRGEVNGCVFPLTGHPPLEVAGWLQYYRTLQAYGINHVRFHSWTPPDGADGHLQVGPGGTRHDYSASIAGIPIPVVSHEIGQFSVLPHYAEMARYTGVFTPHNLEHFRAKAAAAGLLAQADASFAASAKLAALLYREEIEAALRTPGFSGFQLLGLQDFPGQGTALIGLLDTFLESKGAITPEEFRRFCAPHVLLARFDRHTWTAGEPFSADLDLAHYGPAALPAGVIEWELRPTSCVVGACLHAISALNRLQAGSYDEPQAPPASGTLASPAAPAGGLRPLGELRFTLPSCATARQLELRLTLTTASASITATYPLWLYPDCSPTSPTTLEGAAPSAPFPCHGVDGATPSTIAYPDSESILAHAAQPVVLDPLPTALRPIVQVIDNLERCHRLGLIFETRVGPGRLLVCALDLPALAERHPEARQLLASLRAYAASESFAPTVALDPSTLQLVLGTGIHSA